MRFAVTIEKPDVSDEGLATLQRAGVEFIEPWTQFLQNEDKTAIGRVEQRLRAGGVRVYSCHAPIAREADMSLTDDGERRQALTINLRALRCAELLGAECMVFHPTYGDFTGADPTPRIEALMRSLEDFLKATEAVGIRLAMENMFPRIIGQESAVLRRVLDQFDSPWLGVCFDTGHAHTTKEGVETIFKNLKHRVIAFHLHDNDGMRDRHLQPPYGTIDWSSFVEQFKTLAFDKPVTVEAPPWGTRDWAVLLREVRMLFERGILYIPLKGRRVKAICSLCNRRVFGSLDSMACGCDGE